MRSLLCLVIFGLSATAHAQTQNAVRVLFYGGTEDARVVDLFDGESVDLGLEPITPGVLVASSDLKVLGEHHYLLAQSSGEGFSIWEDGLKTFLLDPGQRYRQVTSAAVAGYGPLGPSRVLFSDSYANIVSIRELGTSQNSWFRSLALTGGLIGDIRDTVLLPAGKVAVATNYVAQNLYLVDIFGVSEGTRLQIGNREHTDGLGIAITLIPDLKDLRDLVGRVDGGLLIATATTLYEIDSEGVLTWQYDLGQKVSGEIKSIMTLSSGLIAVATLEPGNWTSPHENHRVLWFDPVGEVVVAELGGLERAPASIDRYSGHGGTGTPGFSSGVELGEGDLSNITIASLQSVQPLYAKGDRVELKVNFINIGSLPVSADELTIELGEGGCQSAQFDREFVSMQDVIIYPAASVQLTRREDVERYTQGQWCARALIRRGADLKVSPATVQFRVAVTNSGNVVVEDLGFGETADMDTDADADMGPVAPPQGGEGCGCQSGGAPGSILFALTLWVLSQVRPRRRS